MTVTTTSFTNDFPEFSNVSYYPPTQIQFWINIAELLLKPCVFQDMQDYATELFVAHNITLSRRNQLAAASGGAPGGSTGALTNKSVDKVSAGYDVSVSAIKDAGAYNLTTYGIMFKQLANMGGIGGVQISGCGVVPSGWGSIWTGWIGWDN